MKESEIRPKELFQKYLELSGKDAESFDNSTFEKVNCIACDSSESKLKILKNGFDYQICTDCGTVFCSPRPTIKDLNNFYWNSKSAKFWFEEFLPKVEESRREKIFKKKALQLFSTIKEKGISISNLCDVGAGSGIFLEELKKIRDDISYYAIEPGQVSSKIIADKGFPVLQSSAETSSDWFDKFDFVVSLEVLEHVNKPLDFVLSMKNLLKRGGYCLITSLGYEGFDILTLGKDSNSISPPHHLNFPSVKGFELLFENAGFTDIQVTTPGILDVDIVLNSDKIPDFLEVLKSRGTVAINEFQEFLIKNKMSSHVWVLAKK
ncbi:MAG: SAM-dependent methyltransferase [Bacteroidetes bacterium GWF2_42_66]|nr:MAG: SAM-dependent methyltransferase [Bacteroidetes bacterium GWA2_42_15]OFX96321.1 MAG: SAM-dependent methyltransferase [Bacteroidetes bacterium GWE2_42_39]OFY46360.1 MAG: SAM-dependent methyltransferase [Bacteroidetes bacterium GWF2_42_66]HAZ03482.1 SAM-dependent methyltransferase [Marinilabiliales bacterium]HBL78254.1 SAM-dependent methyltransferase [Prolixibacteraceae bacterium]